MTLKTQLGLLHVDWETALNVHEDAHGTSGAVTPGGYDGTVNGYVDLGTGLVTGWIVIDVLEIEIASLNEAYRIVVQGCNDPGFGSGIENLTAADFGAGAVRLGGAQTSTVGRYYLGFCNQARDGTNYRYIRLYDVISGTVSTGIKYNAWLSKSDC